MKAGGLLTLSILLALSGTVGCSAVPASSSGLLPGGHWEMVRQIRYGELAPKDLKGAIGPTDAVYMVTMTGFYDDSYGISVGPDDDVRTTRDGGQSWTKAASALFCRHGLEIVDKQVAWHCGNGGTRVSTNGGESWETVAPSACPYLSFLDANSGWAASPYTVQSTLDGGAHWTQLTPLPSSRDIAAMALRTAQDGYILDTAGDLFVTADGGGSWEKRTLGLAENERLISGTEGPKVVMRFVNAQDGMAVFDLADRTVWFAVTQDGGRSWWRAEIEALRDKSYYYHLYLSRDGTLLTATDDFNNGTNTSVVLRYQRP